MRLAAVGSAMPTSRPSRPDYVAVLRQALADFSRDDMSVYASALAYRLLFSLFPFVIFLVALLGFLDLPQLFDWLRAQASTIVPSEGMEVVNRVLDEIQTPRGGLLSIGIVVALFSAAAGVATAMQALSVAYDVQERRPTWKIYGLALLYTVGGAAVIIAAAALMVMGPGVAGWIAVRVGLQDAFVTAWNWLRWPVAVLLLMLVASLIYYLGPNVQHRYRFITAGAVVAVIGWIVASIGFGYYVRSFADYNATYGSLGAVVILVFYFFLSAAVFLFGAEVNAAIERHARGAETAPKEKEGPARGGPGTRMANPS